MRNIKLVTYPFISTACFYLAFSSILHKTPASLFESLFSIDFLLQLLIGVALFSLSKKESIFLIEQVIFMSAVYLASPIKMTYFSSEPFSPYDMAGLVALVSVLSSTMQLIVALVLASIVTLFIYNLRASSKIIVVITGFCVMSSLAFTAYAGSIDKWLNERYLHQIWNKKKDYFVEGATVYFLHEAARLLSEYDKAPDAKTVAFSQQELQKIPPMSSLPPENITRQKGALAKRNLYLVVVESLIDPTEIFNVPEGKDPFFKPFRQLYREGGSSVSLSPVYTGGTANAEFEILCGIPVLDSKITFEYEIKNDKIDCLPDVLGEYGYKTMAVHPNNKHFWNRGFAYPKIGFQEYKYNKYFRRDDMRGSYLSDASLFKQNLIFIEHAGQPLFNYVLTISNHFPYYENGQAYLDLSIHKLLSNYLDSVHYTTREIYTYIESLQKLDPDGLIIVIGDHSPYFGPNLMGYRKSAQDGVNNKSLDAADLVQLTATPLLIIDGKHGPRNVGRVAHYEIPGLILRMLGVKKPVTMQFVSHHDQVHIRPIPGYPVVVWDGSGIQLCNNKNDSKDCRMAKLWRRNVAVLRKDLLYGKQYQLKSQVAIEPDIH